VLPLFAHRAVEARHHRLFSRLQHGLPTDRGDDACQVGNQDHSLMLGVEAADNILFGTKARPAACSSQATQQT